MFLISKFLLFSKFIFLSLPQNPLLRLRRVQKCNSQKGEVRQTSVEVPPFSLTFALLTFDLLNCWGIVSGICVFMVYGKKISVFDYKKNGYFDVE